MEESKVPALELHVAPEQVVGHRSEFRALQVRVRDVVCQLTTEGPTPDSLITDEMFGVQVKGLRETLRFGGMRKRKWQHHQVAWLKTLAIPSPGAPFFSRSSASRWRIWTAFLGPPFLQLRVHNPDVAGWVTHLIWKGIVRQRTRHTGAIEYKSRDGRDESTRPRKKGVLLPRDCNRRRQALKKVSRGRFVLAAFRRHFLLSTCHGYLRVNLPESADAQLDLGALLRRRVNLEKYAPLEHGAAATCRVIASASWRRGRTSRGSGAARSATE
jgi:hypothetical protein